MLFYALWGANESPSNLSARLGDLWNDPARREELLALLGILQERQSRITLPLEEASRVPLRVHGDYSRDEILAAFGHTQPSSVRQGVVWIPGENADLFFITLKKTERHYSPTTRYRDYAISAGRFHWESQNSTSADSPVGQRYIHHARRGSSVHLFIRESKEGPRGALPYLYAGPAVYHSHQGDRPMQILWELAHMLPADLLDIARIAA